MHTKVLIWANEWGIVRMQDRGGWRFIKIPSHQIDEMLSSGVGHFVSTLINRFLANSSASWQPKGEKQHRWSSSSATTGPGGWWMSHCDATKRCHCKLGQHPPPPSLNIDVVHYELPQVARVGPRRPHGQGFNRSFEAWIVKSGILTQCVVEGDANPHNNSDRQNTHYFFSLIYSSLCFNSRQCGEQGG